MNQKKNSTKTRNFIPFTIARIIFRFLEKFFRKVSDFSLFSKKRISYQKLNSLQQVSIVFDRRFLEK